MTTFDKKSDGDLTRYFDGSALYGDDFGPDEIADWFRSEQDAYLNVAAQQGGHIYGYRAADDYHFFRRIEIKPNSLLLGLGGADGREYMAISDKISEFHILEISESFWVQEINRKPAHYRKPNASGVIDYDGSTFDLATCFSVLHHIPNVTFVLSEIFRVLKPGGMLLLREPIVSMGDWQRPRPGLTKNERGLPLGYFERAVADIGFDTVRRALCGFPAIQKIGRILKIQHYNHIATTILDHAASNLFAFNVSYNSTTFFGKLAPGGIAMILRKP